MREATIETHRSYGSVWKVGDALFGYETPRGGRPRYTALICIKAREVGPRGGFRKPAESAVITGPSWESIQWALQSLGFERSTLTATQVQEGLSAA